MATRYSGHKRYFAGNGMPGPKRHRIVRRGAAGWLQLVPGRVYFRRSSCTRVPRQSVRFSFEEQDITDGGAIVQINSLVAGITNSRRLSAKVRWTRLIIRGRFSLSTEAAEVNRYHAVYCWLVWDKTPGEDVPRVSDVFSGGEEPDLWEKNIENEKGFSVLWEKHGTLIGAGSHPTFPHRKSLPMIWSRKLNHTIEYKDTTDGDVGDMHSGALYLVIASYYPEAVSFTARCRLYFQSICP